MKRFLSLSLLCLALAGTAAAESPSGMLLVVTGAYYDAQGGGVLVTARPARVELPPGAAGDEYVLVEDPEETFSLRADAYLAVPAELPVYGVRLLQADVNDFPIYLHDFLSKMDSARFQQEPPQKGNGIAYREYSLLYRAAVTQGEISSLTYCQLPEGFAP